MRWIIDFLSSSIGKKLVMSLTGLFLISFLIVHLLGNLQLLIPDGGKAFNIYAHFMSTNIVIKFISIGLYVGILLHAIQGIIIVLDNRKAKGSKYAVNTYENGNWLSKNMALLGTFILFFLCVHMGDFWYKVKFTDTLDLITYPDIDYQVKDIYQRVSMAFGNVWIVVIYIVGLIALALHLIHGFQSAFTTLGLQHPKYTPAINVIGILFSVGISLLYALIPLYMYFAKLSNY
ncbi:MAG: succinate dehydrogenase cytochrome b subunit [Saprospiraceae bacterium]|nr:succinate dehydrogenase cytochrome b subunit [Bacteroidia bacterium]NNE15050.1 succinate dehydrogenase cytochrome b subunit [Saprospiraceae bacterium]NNL93257.1 succinate dehydrogenase cytochrome b subunit [Saprospiraceae bacterium]